MDIMQFIIGIFFYIQIEMVLKENPVDIINMI